MESKKSLSELMKDDNIFYEAEIKIGPFKIMNEIGKGKFSTVFLGIHEETKQKVAIKQLKKSEINTDNVLIKEINIQKIFFHPYLTQMYCVIEKSESIFIISEYCAKGDINSNLIENGIFDEANSCKIFQQIISSLEYLHKNNICHRDIKPENILLTENSEAKLSDFGLSKYFKKNELLNTTCGSPIYAAPEMLEGKPYDGTKIDIWGLGITLYTMLCGDFPFSVEDENDIKTLIDNITKGNYKEPEYISNECKDLIRLMLEKNPEKRINIDDIKKHKWVNMFEFNYMKSPGIFLDRQFLPVDIYLVKDICRKDENKIKKLIKDILENNHNENSINYYLKINMKINKGEKSVGDLRPNSELFLNYINNNISLKQFWENDINKIENYYFKQVLELFNKESKEIQSDIKKNKTIKDNNNKLEKNNNLKILNDYIGPLIFIHDIIEEIINKAILIKHKKNILSNLLVSSTSMEIKNKKQNNIKISKENNIDIKGIKNDKIKNKENFSINKINDIEFFPISISDTNRTTNYKIDKQNIIKNIELNNEGILLLYKDKNNIKEKKSGNTDINNLQINLIENEIIINDLNLSKELENRISLKKNCYSYDVNKNCYIKGEENNKILLKTKKKESKTKINKIPESRIHSNSVDFRNNKKFNANDYLKDKEEKIIKNNILMTNYRKFKENNKNINTFIKSSFNDSKKDKSSLFNMNSPKIIIQKNPKNYFQIDENKKNKENHLNKYNNFSQKDFNTKREINKEKKTPKKNEKGELRIFNKKLKQEENHLIKTSVSFDKIKQVIKKLVGNNVVENNAERNFKFICKTKIGKDDLNFNLELISKNFETRIFRGTLIQGETRLYKDLLLKIKEKLS